MSPGIKDNGAPDVKYPPACSLRPTVNAWSQKMKKLVITLCFALLGLSLFGQGGLRYTIQVRKFENKANWSGRWNLGDAWGAVLTDKLQQSGEFIVVAEQDMRREAIAEQDFAQSGRVAGGKKAPKTGQMTPAQLMIKGAITQFDDGTSGGGGGASYRGIRVGVKGGKSLISGTVYVVDSTTGQVTASKNFEAVLKKRGLNVGVARNGWAGDLGGFQKTPVGKIMNEAADQVVAFLRSQTESIAWSGTIIKGGDSRIIINRGSREGVSVGQEFVIGEAEEIRDPDTGELLDTDFVETGRIEITQVKEKLAYAKKVSGRAPKKGQTVYAK